MKPSTPVKDNQSETHTDGICIIESTSVAGTGRIKGIDQIVASFSEHELLSLVRDRDNYFDEWAVKVTDRTGRKIGFISCDCNEIVSRMIDGGMSLVAKFNSAVERDGWMDVRIKVIVHG